MSPPQIGLSRSDMLQLIAVEGLKVTKQSAWTRVDCMVGGGRRGYPYISFKNGDRVADIHCHNFIDHSLQAPPSPFYKYTRLPPPNWHVDWRLEPSGYALQPVKQAVAVALRELAAYCRRSG